MSGLQEPDQPRDLDAEARRALELAVDEAVELGHDRIGTEHLLLGLLANAGTRAARVLADAGVTLNAARHKVAEASGPKARAARRTAGPAKSPRATRALNRAVRFSHAARSELVTSEHVLLGVLDVEGTAGQVLRRLGVDLDRVREALETDAEVAPEPGASPAARPPAPLVCHACGSALGGGIAAHELDVRAPAGVFAITAFGCAACGAFLGLGPR